MSTISTGLLSWVTEAFSGKRVAVYGVLKTGDVLNETYDATGTPQYRVLTFGPGTSNTVSIPSTLTVTTPAATVDHPLLGEIVSGTTTLAAITDFTISG